jgi:hypothetical protein
MITDDQHGASTLQAIASLVSAFAWPVLVAVLLFCYRKTIRLILPILIEKFRSADTIELAGIKLTHAKDVIEEALQGTPSEPPQNAVPKSQVASAQTLDAKLASVGFTPSETAPVVDAQVAQLANEYETIRSTMSSGQPRTDAMNRVMAKMRTLGIRMLPLRDRLALSPKPGQRLAAIASLQVQPDESFIRWLTERLYVEAPFVFFHACLAISELAQKFGISEPAREELQRALDHARSFPSPDENTIRVLRQILG